MYNNPEYAKQLEDYIQEEELSRRSIIDNLNKNIQKIQNKLQNPAKYRKFFWTPDYNIYGFGSKNDID